VIPVLKSMIHALLWDPMAFRRWARGFALWLGGAAVMVASVGWEVAQHWTLREWLGRLAIAGVLGIGGLISVGEKNAAAPQPPPSAGFGSLEILLGLAGASLLVVLGLALKASLVWGGILVAVMAGVGLFALAGLAGADPEGRGGTIMAWAAAGGALLLLLAVLGAIGRVIWWVVT
jgi:hypothetical protein